MAPVKPKLNPPIEAIDTFLAQQDMLSALLVWVILEGLSLLLLPHFSLLSSENHKMSTWVAISASMGIGGALLIGLSSSWLQYCQIRISRHNRNKGILVFLGNLVSCLGLVGIGFPLIMVFIELLLLVLKGEAI